MGLGASAPARPVKKSTTGMSFVGNRTDRIALQKKARGLRNAKQRLFPPAS